MMNLNRKPPGQQLTNHFSKIIAHKSNQTSNPQTKYLPSQKHDLTPHFVVSITTMRLFLFRDVVGKRIVVGNEDTSLNAEQQLWQGNFASHLVQDFFHQQYHHSEPTSFLLFFWGELTHPFLFEVLKALLSK